MDKKQHIICKLASIEGQLEGTRQAMTLLKGMSCWEVIVENLQRIGNEVEAVRKELQEEKL